MRKKCIWNWHARYEESLLTMELLIAFSTIILTKGSGI